MCFGVLLLVLRIVSVRLVRHLYCRLVGIAPPAPFLVGCRGSANNVGRFSNAPSQKISTYIYKLLAVVNSVCPACDPGS